MSAPAGAGGPASEPKSKTDSSEKKGGHGKHEAGLATDKLAEELTCAICLSIYHDPRVLHCMHTLCLACCIPLVRAGAIECPLCKKQTVVGVAGAHSLGRNLVAAALADKVAGVLGLPQPRQDPLPGAAASSSQPSPHPIYAARADSPPPNVAPYSYGHVHVPLQPVAGPHVHYPVRGAVQSVPAQVHYPHPQSLSYGIPVGTPLYTAQPGIPYGQPIYQLPYPGVPFYPPGSR